jgi:hypothetical protein
MLRVLRSSVESAHRSPQTFVVIHSTEGPIEIGHVGIRPLDVIRAEHLGSDARALFEGAHEAAP